MVPFFQSSGLAYLPLKRTNVFSARERLMHGGIKKKEKRLCVSAISFFNERVAKNERDSVSFQILNPDDLFKQIFLKSLKSC